MAIEDYLKDSANSIDPYERYPELGNGRYKLKPRGHKWHEGDYGPVLLATVEVLESEPISGGIEGFPVTEPGAIRTFKINGYADVKAKGRALGQTKSWVARVLGQSPQADLKWMQLARDLCNQDGPALHAKFANREIALEIVVNKGEHKEWRRVTFL